MWTLLLFAVFLTIGLTSRGNRAADTRHALLAIVIVLGYVGFSRHLM